MTRLHSAATSRWAKIFVAEWAIFCVLLFLLFPGRLSFLHSEVVNGALLSALPSKAAQYDFLKFFADIFFSLLKITASALAFLSAGAVLIPNFKTRAPAVLLLSSAFLAGHFAFSVVFFALAFFKVLTPLHVALVFLAGTLIGLPALYKKILPPAKEIRLGEIFARGFRWLNFFAAAVILSALLLSSSRFGYDATYLYFSDAKAATLTHGLHFFQGNLFPVSAAQTTIQFSALASIFGDQTARLFSWISGLWVFALSLSLAGRLGLSEKGRSVLAVMLASTIALTDLLGDAKVDLTAAAIVLASISWILVGENARETFWAGLFAGLAMSSRPYNLFLLGVFIPLLYLLEAYAEKANPRAWKRLIQSGAWMAAGAAIPLVLNLLANWAVLGSPLAMVADVSGLPADKWQWAFDPDYIWVMRLLLPFALSFFNTSQSIGVLTPLFLGFLPLLAFAEIRKKINLAPDLKRFLAAALITLVLWILAFYTIVEIRYVFFLWILLYMPVAEALAAALDSPGFPLRGALRFTIGLLMVFNLLRVLVLSLETYSPLDKQGNPQCRDHFFCDYLVPINEQAPRGARVLSLTAYRYYLRTDLFVCSTFDGEYWRLRDASLQSPEAFWEEAYRQGYEYVAYEGNYSVRHLYIDFVPSPESAPSWMKLVPLYDELPPDVVAAYRIEAANPPVAREKACVLRQDGVWEVQPVQK